VTVLHVLVGQTCNNNCLFCMEADRDGRERHARRQSPGDVRRMIASYPDREQILFTSGEPTLCPRLLDYVGWARDAGFARIGVITNGRRLAYRHYAERLVDAGVNRITISVHGHTSKLHDGLTRTPGSYRQTRAGLANCAEIKRRRDLQVHTSTVVTRRNLAHLRAIHAMLRTFRADEIVFNVMMAKGRGAKHLDALMPRYRDVVAAVIDLCATLDEEAVRRTHVVDLPPCVTRKLPPGIGGELEEFDQYEPTGSTGVMGLEVFNPGSTESVSPVRNPLRGRAALLSKRLSRGGISHWFQEGRRRGARSLSRLARRSPAPVTLQAFHPSNPAKRPTDAVEALRRRAGVPVLEGEADFYVTRRSVKDQFLRVKGPPCQRCSLCNTCPGVWEAYADRFGWQEIDPL